MDIKRDMNKHKARGLMANNAKTELLISALLTHPTIKEASDATGIPESTIYNYLKKPSFKEKYNKAKFDIIKQTTTYLQGLMSDTVRIIHDIASDEEIQPQARITACRTLLEYSVKFTETNDIIQRLEEITKAANGEV